MSGNIGCGCNCNNDAGRQMKNQGEAGWVTLAYFDTNGEQSLLPEGKNMLVGFFDMKSKPLAAFRTDDGTIEEWNGLYRFHMPHSLTTDIVGTISMELTIYDGELSDVRHADRIVTITFNPRNNNQLL